MSFQGPITHDYILMAIQLSTASGDFDGFLPSRIWARCERHPGSIAGGFTRLSKDSAPALDTIKFSVNKHRLRAPEDKVIMMCDYEDLRVQNIADLLSIIHKASPQ